MPSVIVAETTMAVHEFLRQCLDPSTDLDDHVQDACARFIEAGRQALATGGYGAGWIQRNLTVPEPTLSPPLYESIAALIRQVQAEGLADLAFFMHKPPGMRLRLLPSTAVEQQLEYLLDGSLTSWQRSGFLASWHPAVYEAETRLFGGVRSIEHVHALFAVDSLAWLDLHALSGDDPHAPTWATSLLMLHALLAALSISDWEDVDVWERVRRTGRSLPVAILDAPESADLFTEIRSAWNQPQSLFDGLSPAQRTIVQRYEDAVQPIATGWRREYFETSGACLGPRAAAALCIIFHWNRAALPMTRQSLICEALLTRETI